MRALRLLALTLLVAVVGLGVAALITGAGLFSFGWMLAGGNVQKALDDLPRVPVLERLGTDAGAADIIVFRDGRDGWFVVRDPQALASVEIGFYGQRFGEAMFGASHVPSYCASSVNPDAGKIVWAVREAALIHELAFCNARRMALDEMRPLADPVTMHEAERPRAEVLALQAEIAADASLMAVRMPQVFEPFDLYRSVTLPANWFLWGDDRPASHILQQRLEAALTMHMEAFDGQYDLRFSSSPAQELTRYTAETGVAAPAETGPSLAVDGQTFITTGVNWIDRIVMEVGCQPEACAALEVFDPMPILAEGRDPALLADALANLILIEGRNPSEANLTEAQLRDERVNWSDPQSYQYFVRWISLR